MEYLLKYFEGKGFHFGGWEQSLQKKKYRVEKARHRGMKRRSQSQWSVGADDAWRFRGLDHVTVVGKLVWRFKGSCLKSTFKRP